MRTLFSRILLAQVLATVFALAVVTLITRVSLELGFENFLRQQEAEALQQVAPMLADVYRRERGWEQLSDNPNAWRRIWRINRAAAAAPRGGPGGGPGTGNERPRESAGPAIGQGLDPDLRWLARPGRGLLRERLFLLDADRRHVAGEPPDSLDGINLEAIRHAGQVVGWVGFGPSEDLLPTDARRFLSGQLKITALALAVALVVAVVLAWALARTVSRPVQHMAQTVRRLSHGDYGARVLRESSDEIGRLSQHVNQLAASLEQSRTARQRWMADIAHELRTPVAVMKGEIEAIADGVRAVDQGATASLLEEIDQLARMVDDLQALALADAGALDLRKERIDLAGLAAQVTEMFRTRLAERRIRLDTRLDEEAWVTGDAQRLRQLLHNLLENSVRYAQEGATVRLAVRGNDPVHLALEDSGPGVDEEQLAQLFDRFYRVEGSRARATGGSGLGLSICRTIVEAHGGGIRAEHSELGGLAILADLPAGDRA
jgi:two-component system sensor histidine kinase BaeS